ncbi:MAG: hypothetical protein JSS34_05865 [Proteobacteria bacterium]|nr:hypothetical protein [Pseudomonadota bacterium]
MNTIFDIEMILSAIEPYLPYMVTSFLFTALSVIGVLTYIVLKSLKSSSPSSAPSSTSQPVSKEKDMIFKSSKFTEFIALFGYLPITPLGKSFVNALQVLRKNIGGSDYKYKLPWFLLIGPENSGKTTFIQNANLPLPLGKPFLLKEGEEAGCSWSFFDQGVVLDISGSYLIEEKTTQSNNQNWIRLFRLLSHFRVKRPLDGLILTIPATELWNNSNLDVDSLLERSNTIYQKLSLIENKLGLNIPIYVVITKCDLIPGFKNFTSSLSSSQKAQIFGWSSPYDPLENFQGEWVEEAFEDMMASLTLNQLEIFTLNIDDSLKDGVILFPQNFQKLQETLQLYLTSIFKNVGYREAFFCRGIYFTGDTSWQPEDVENDTALANLEGRQPLNAYNMINDRKVAFVTQLLEDKIFPEYILATPGQRRIIASSRAINVMRVVTFLTFLMLSYGIWRDHENLHKTIFDLNPLLQKIFVDLEEKKEFLNTQKDSENVEFFSDRAKTLLLLMSKLEHTKFFFYTLPPSWTGFFYNSIEKVLSFSNEEIFLYAIGRKLVDKANEIIKNPVASYTGNSELVNNPIDPLQTSEFFNLNNYVVSLRELEKYINFYNNLPNDPNTQHISDLVFYLFGFNLPKIAYGKGEFYKRSFLKIKENPIDLSSYKVEAQEKLKSLFKLFLFSIFEKNLTNYHLLTLSEAFKIFELPSTGQVPFRHDLDDILTKMNTLISLLDNPHLEWLNFDSFDPGETYNQIIGMIYESYFFTNEIGDNLVLEANTSFKKFKEKLLKIGSNLTGPFFEVQNGKLVSGPSLGLLRVQSAFAEFLSMSFMEPSDELAFAKEILPNTQLYWDGQLVNEALDLVNEFNTFLTDNLTSYPLGLQEAFRLISVKSTQQKVTSLLAQAQDFVDSTIFLQNYAPEEAIRRQIANLKPNIPTFMTLIQAMKLANLDIIFLEFRDLLSNQLIQILLDIDQVLESEGLYEPIDTTFSEWTGDMNAAFLSYNVPDETSLRAYLDLIRERISYLSVNYAATILNFLNFSDFHLMSENISLLTKWTLILDAVTAFNNKKPGNSISTLQNFILKDMNTITVSNCAQKLDPLVTPEHQDFFTNRLQELRSDLLGRCEALSGKIALNHYDQIQTFFNTRLAGKFPFIGTATKNASGYAEPQDIKAFFSLYDNLVVSAKEFLNASKSYGISKDRALEFIMAMDDVRAFFDPFLTSKNLSDLPTYDFDVEFRVNRSHEVGASQLIDWVIQVGPQDIDLHSANFSGIWSYGTPVTVSFQWASNGPNQPMTDGNQPNLSVTGNTATYTYNGPWALLELILMQDTPLTEFSNLTDPNPQTLFFKIPTRGALTPNNPSSIPAKLFMRITPKAPEKQGGLVLTVPYFPDAAPVLSH